MPGPMAGIKVVEMGVWIAGPAAALVLADWGAEVVKIEPPGVGDPARTFAQMLGADLPFNPPFEMDNRGKKSAVLNLSTAEGKAVARELVAGADVFISNMRARALQRMGFAPEQLLKQNPRLVYGQLTGYGNSGPERDRAAYDIAAYWARSGIAHMLQPAGAPPPLQRGGMGDHNAGMALAGAIAAALYQREKSGRGQLVSTSLVRQGAFTLAFDLASVLRFGVNLAVGNRKTMGNPCINSYREKNGRWFWVVGLEGERHWPALCEVAGHPEWMRDPRFNERRARAQNAAELIAMLDEIFARKTLAEWRPIFDATENFWWAPVQNLEEVCADEQLRAAGIFCEVPDEEAGGATTLPATPADFHGTPWRARAMAPAHGQHTEEILREQLGRTPEQINALRAAGALG